MDNKIKAVSYYCANKYGTKYTPASLEALYSLHYEGFENFEIIEFIEDKYGENVGYKVFFNDSSIIVALLSLVASGIF